MSLQVTILSALRKGICRIDDIVKEYGFSHVQIYNAGRELLKKKQIQQPVPGIHGEFCLLDSVSLFSAKTESKTVKPTEIETPAQQPVESPVVAEEKTNLVPSLKPTMSGFNFNEHFNNLVELMAAKITMDIETRVREKLGPMAELCSAELIKKVELASESILSQIAAKASLQSEVVQQPPKSPEEKKVVSRLPKICVANLKPVQCGEISSEFGETFDLVFWNGKTGNSTQQLTEFAKNCDVVFWHTSHSSHSAEAMVKKAGGNLVRVSGALSQMRKALLEYYTHTSAYLQH